MQEIQVDGEVKIKAWVDGVEFEDAAREQVMHLAKLPFLFHHVAVMPDVHAGRGSTVGTVMATRGAVIPAACGVDIGCGMIAKRTKLKAEDLPDSLSGLRFRIETAVPHGRTANGGPGDRGAWGNAPEKIETYFATKLFDGYREILTIDPQLAHKGVVSQLGTLGTGNHFIEICLDENQDVWIMLHSGSRGVGNKIGSHYIDLAKRDMKRYMINLPDEDLAYIPEGSKHFDDYCNAVEWAQKYAFLNRQIMMKNVEACLAEELGLPLESIVTDEEQAVNCHHNYISRENHFGKNVLITRKGAVSAREGQLGIIPASMGRPSVIVRGKGNRDSYNSCSHGSGRRMSRNAAKKAFTLEDHRRATQGIECRKDEGVIDETPMAYKDHDAVMRAQADLVDIEHTLTQVACIKG